MKKFIIGLIFLTIILPNGKSEALSCAESPPPEIAFERYDGVIKGTVKAIEEKRKENVLTVHVSKSYKGVAQNIIAVEEDSMWGESRINEDYLFYLMQEDGKWTNPLCSQTTNSPFAANGFLIGQKEIALEEVGGVDSPPQASRSLQVLFQVY